jgi:hypothetical protein
MASSRTIVRLFESFCLYLWSILHLDEILVPQIWDVRIEALRIFRQTLWTSMVRCDSERNRASFAR